MPSELTINLNTEILSTVIKGNLSDFYNQSLTPEVINRLTAQLIESIDLFINKNDKDN